MSASAHTDRRILNAGNWRTYYISPRMRQIEDALFDAGVRTSRVSPLVLKADAVAAGRLAGPLWVTGDRLWLLFTERGFLRVKRKMGRRRPTLRQIEQLEE